MIHLDILIGCLITVVSEVLFFILFGYRSKPFVITAILANVTSNLALNYFIYALDLMSRNDYFILLVFLEVIVWAYEAVMYLLVERKEKSKRLEIVLLTLAANCISILLGFLYYSLPIFGH